MNKNQTKINGIGSVYFRTFQHHHNVFDGENVIFLAVCTFRLTDPLRSFSSAADTAAATEAQDILRFLSAPQEKREGNSNSLEEKTPVKR
jgi:hypothetical protein